MVDCMVWTCGTSESGAALASWSSVLLPLLFCMYSKLPLAIRARLTFPTNTIVLTVWLQFTSTLLSLQCVSLNSLHYCRHRDFVKSRRRVLGRAEILHLRIGARAGVRRWKQGVRNRHVMGRARGKAEDWVRTRMCAAAVAALVKTSHRGTTRDRWAQSVSPWAALALFRCRSLLNHVSLSATSCPWHTVSERSILKPPFPATTDSRYVVLGGNCVLTAFVK